MLVGDYVWNMPGQHVFELSYNGRVFVFTSYGRDVRVSTDGVQMPLQYRVEKDAFCLRVGDFYFEVSQMFGDNAAKILLYVHEPIEGIKHYPQSLAQYALNQFTAPTKKFNRSVLLLI